MIETLDISEYNLQEWLPMSDFSFTVRPMAVDDLPACLALTQGVNWPHRMIDWQLHYQLGNGSAIVDEQGELIGIILWWDYGPEYATVGLVVVPEHMQGKGLGRKLMNTVMAQTGERNLQLVATNAGKRLYEQCGFAEQGLIYQVQGIPHSKPGVLLPNGISIRSISLEQLDDIIALDGEAYQAQRKELLKTLLKVGKCCGLYVNDTLQSFGFVRESGRGQTIGPIVANTDENAKLIATALLQKCDNFVRFDLTDLAKALKVWLLTLGLKETENACLMVKGDYLPAKASHYFNYALASQAFG
jgi:GNAT superfamily N-acetyltransferase